MRDFVRLKDLHGLGALRASRREEFLSVVVCVTRRGGDSNITRGSAAITHGCPGYVRGGLEVLGGVVYPLQELGAMGFRR